MLRLCSWALAKNDTRLPPRGRICLFDLEKRTARVDKETPGMWYAHGMPAEKPVQFCRFRLMNTGCYLELH